MSTADTLLAAVPRSPSAGIKALARLGFAAIGVVYVLMGVLALLAALSRDHGVQADKEAAVKHLQDLPAGSLLLGLIAVGLLGYIIWRFTQAIRDTEGKGSGAKGWSFRLWYICSGLFYSGLALYAGRLALRGHADEGADTSKSLAATILGWPSGDWLLIFLGVVTIGIGLFQGYRAYSHKLQSDVDGQDLTAAQQRLVYRAAQVGVTARGVVVSLIGYFFVEAGWQSRAAEAGSTNEALGLLAGMGPLVLGVVAAGLVLYGLYSLVQARYPILRGL
ncbi:DUF1206 domain-containing protein [Hymenobacter sp. BT770]|uniref:DUF1206 domain-containing protein n=1 Tax=Hymenobacter sp. BT770 TaxID=2886942 RepID=UPI001D126BE1|nr:DUF1206 domain-containing protein [Hymenobacter sp. BT770]MCC3151857.1 DUF1206 domain-containing protein [Hymenobacter sp. BT770]MDO3413521.1 DUF1206 domain-containing protein [Hymenobacter sp. BT770]